MTQMSMQQLVATDSPVRNLPRVMQRRNVVASDHVPLTALESWGEYPL